MQHQPKDQSLRYRMLMMFLFYLVVLNWFLSRCVNKYNTQWFRFCNKMIFCEFYGHTHSVECKNGGSVELLETDMFLCLMSLQ